MKLPYRYTDVDGDQLAVFTANIPGQGRGLNVRTTPAGCSVPTADAVALARAVLAAAGNTGHRVVSEERIRDLEAKLRTEENAHIQTIDDRDCYEEWADKLAAAIAPAEVRGEHSNANNPWRNALDYAAGRYGAAPTPAPVTADNTKETP